MRLKITVSKIMAFVILTSALSLLGCAQWPQAQDVPLHNPFRSKPKFKLGKLPEISANKTSEPVLKAQWNSRLAWLSEGISLYPKILPTIDSQRVYQANHKGKLVALDKKTGNQKWVLTSYKIASGPVLINDTLLITTQDAKVVAVDKKTGKTLWERDISSETLALPCGNTHQIVVHSTDGKISALNAQDGKLLWTYESRLPALMLRGSSSPRLINGLVLSGLANGQLVALHADSGMIAWEKTLAFPKGRSDLNRMVDIRSDLIIQEESLFVAAFQGHINKIHLATGETQWQREISSYHTLQLDDEALYVTDAQHHIWALDKDTGATLWEQDALADRYISAPCLLDSFIVVGDKGGYLHFLNKKTGQIEKSYRVGNKIVSDLVVDNDNLLVSSQNGQLSVFKVSSKVKS